MSPSHRLQCSRVVEARRILGGLCGGSHVSGVFVSHFADRVGSIERVQTYADFAEAHIAALCAEVLHAVESKLSQIARVFTSARDKW